MRCLLGHSLLVRSFSLFSTLPPQKHALGTSSSSADTSARESKRALEQFSNSSFCNSCLSQGKVDIALKNLHECVGIWDGRVKGLEKG